MKRSSPPDRCSQPLVGPAPPVRNLKGKKKTWKLTRQEEKLIICSAHIQHYIMKAIQCRVFAENTPNVIRLLTTVDEQIRHTMDLLDDYHTKLSK